MYRDPLQERLYQMELKSPSENLHPKSLLEAVADATYFLRRYFSGVVEEYTNEQRSRDNLLKIKEEVDRICAFRTGCLVNRPRPEPSPLRYMVTHEQIRFVMTGQRPARLESIN